MWSGRGVQAKADAGLDTAREAGVNIKSSGTDSDMGVEDRY